MRHHIRKTAAALALLFGLSACADLDVTNPNAPDTQRALQTAGDVESLIAGSYGQWWQTAMTINGPNPILANQSFMWSAFPANFGMFVYSVLPRPEINNSPTDQFYGNMISYTWNTNYRALSAIAQGLQALDDAERGLAEELGAQRVLRARAYGKFVQGLAHGSLALHYNEVFIVDETTDVETLAEPVDYQTAMDAALGYFDEAISLASGASFPNIPATWMSVEVSPSQLVRLAHSMKARYRANVARTPAEREAVNWGAVIADVDAGLTETFNMETGYFIAGFWNHYMAAYMAQHPVGWQQMSYFIMGMADQSGRYQQWVQLPNGQKHPNMPGDVAFLVETPDLRFPQGADLEEQIDNPGIQHIENVKNEVAGSYFVVGPQDWRNPERGTHRWSYYRAQHMEYHRTTAGTAPTPEVTVAEMNLLKAEGLYHMGDYPGAADLINITRTRAGLNELAGAVATNAENTDCVPRLWTGECGDLWEMLKWEKRIETHTWGVHSNSWFFDGRGWGDLYVGTALHVPVPCLDRELLNQSCDTFGGVGGADAAPVSSYAFPHEG